MIQAQLDVADIILFSTQESQWSNGGRGHSGLKLTETLPLKLSRIENTSQFTADAEANVLQMNIICQRL